MPLKCELNGRKREWDKEKHLEKEWEREISNKLAFIYIYKFGSLSSFTFLNWDYISYKMFKFFYD